VHHRLLDMGITHKRAVLILYGVSVVLTIAAIGVSLGRSWQVGVAILTASVVVVGMVRFLNYFEYLLMARRQSARLRSAETESLRRILPQAVASFAGASNDEAIWRTLEGLLERAGLAAVELLRDGVRVRTLRAGNAPKVADFVSVRFPLGEDRLARAALEFRWVTSMGDISPQAEVLLQVLVDIVVIALVRAKSPFAPALRDAAAAHEPLSSREPSGAPV
jgi:UDP-GlcNAc:undecaprenyl-phosphate GlcNAc-1-phosphate transferase